MADLHEELRYVDHALVHMGERWYHWMDVKIFGWSGGDLDLSAGPLRAWLAHPQLNDHYCGPANSSSDNEPALHGPYWASAVTPEAFRSIEAAEAVSAVEAYCDKFEASDEARAEVERVVLEPLREARFVWRLSPLDVEALHEWGSVLDDFGEFVFLGAGGSELRVVVIGSD